MLEMIMILERCPSWKSWQQFLPLSDSFRGSDQRLCLADNDMRAFGIVSMSFIELLRLSIGRSVRGDFRGYGVFGVSEVAI